jgi:hypothetical protein
LCLNLLLILMIFSFFSRSVPEIPNTFEDLLLPVALPVPGGETPRLTREDARILLFGAREERSLAQAGTKTFVAPMEWLPDSHY